MAWQLACAVRNVCVRRAEGLHCTEQSHLVALVISHKSVEEAEGSAGGGAPQTGRGGKLKQPAGVQHVVSVVQISMLH